MCMTGRPYDLVVVGAGIAGLAIAEIFSRAGQRVALIEKNQKICTESSGAHHEWFHFGSLYSIFPSNQFMRTLVGGIDDLLTYYSEMPGMNLSVGDDGTLQVDNKPNGWIRDLPIDYIVAARNDPDFLLSRFEGPVNYAKKLFFLLTWEMAIKQFISRHQRFHKFDWRSGQASKWVPKAGWLDYSRDVIYRITQLDARLDKNTHFRVPGFDRPMVATAIIHDLLHSFLVHGGELIKGSGATSYRTKSNTPVEIILDNGVTIQGEKLILTSGKTLPKFFDRSGPKLNVVASPLLVVYPQVCRQNFVRLTPFQLKTVNHLCHTVGDEPYSLIGGGYFADANSPEKIEKCRNDLVDMASQVFPGIAKAEVVETYVSYKTELVNSGGERNYQYQTKQIEDNVYLAIPGKFSLAFSLALDAYAKLTHSKPPKYVSTAVELDVSEHMAPIRHRQIIQKHLGLQ